MRLEGDANQVDIDFKSTSFFNDFQPTVMDCVCVLYAIICISKSKFFLHEVALSMTEKFPKTRARYPRRTRHNTK